MQCNAMFREIYFGKAIGIHFGTLSLQWYKKITVQPAKEIQQVTGFIYTFLKLKVLSGHMSCPQHFSVRLDLNARLMSWHRETPSLETTLTSQVAADYALPLCALSEPKFQ